MEQNLFCLKRYFPFRIGTTSYILQADILKNSEFLAPLVDDIELVLFESDEISNLPEKKEIEYLVEIGRKFGISYTVHLPLDIYLASSDEEIRKKSISKCMKVINITSCLKPFGYIIHFNSLESDRFRKKGKKIWREILDTSICEIINSGVDSKLLCVETLDYPFEVIEDILTKRQLSVCLDIGHLLLYGYSWERYLNKFLNQIKIIHLHGNEKGVDHKAISLIDSDFFKKLKENFERFNFREFVLTIEVFSQKDLHLSLETLLRFY